MIMLFTGPTYQSFRKIASNEIIIIMTSRFIAYARKSKFSKFDDL